MTWIQPDSASGTGWTTPSNAIDGNTGTSASYNVQTTPSNYLELSLNTEIKCDSVRLYVTRQNTQVNNQEVDVYYGDAWVNIYNGAPQVGAYYTFNIGSEETVSAMRVRFTASVNNRVVNVHDSSFNKTGEAGPKQEDRFVTTYVAPIGGATGTEGKNVQDRTATAHSAPIYTEVISEKPGTIVQQVSASSDDVLIIPFVEYFGLDYGENIVGYYSSFYPDTGSGMRFTNIEIPEGATITEAYFSGVSSAYRDLTVVNTRIRAQKALNPGTFTNYAEFASRTWTTKYVNWDDLPTWENGVTYNSPDIGDIIQEVIDQEGWQSGNAIVILWDDFEQRSTQTGVRVRCLLSYDASPENAPTLTIKFTMGALEPKIEDRFVTAHVGEIHTEATSESKHVQDRTATAHVAPMVGATSTEGKHVQDRTIEAHVAPINGSTVVEAIKIEDRFVTAYVALISGATSTEGKHVQERTATAHSAPISGATTQSASGYRNIAAHIRTIHAETSETTVVTRKWQVGALSDDALVSVFQETVATNAGFICGYYSATYPDTSTLMRFTNVAIPPGATVVSAAFSGVCSTSRSTTVVNTRIRAQKALNPGTFSDYTDFTNRSWTDAYVNWDAIPAWTATQTYESPDLADVIQEVIDQDGWTSGNAIVLFWDDLQQRSTQSTGTDRYLTSYEESAGNATTLEITYSTEPEPTDYFEFEYEAQTERNLIPSGLYEDRFVTAHVSLLTGLTQSIATGIRTHAAHVKLLDAEVTTLLAKLATVTTYVDSIVTETETLLSKILYAAAHVGTVVAEVVATKVKITTTEAVIAAIHSTTTQIRTINRTITSYTTPIWTTADTLLGGIVYATAHVAPLVTTATRIASKHLSATSVVEPIHVVTARAAEALKTVAGYMKTIASGTTRAATGSRTLDTYTQPLYGAVSALKAAIIQATAYVKPITSVASTLELAVLTVTAYVDTIVAETQRIRSGLATGTAYIAPITSITERIHNVVQRVSGYVAPITTTLSRVQAGQQTLTSFVAAIVATTRRAIGIEKFIRFIKHQREDDYELTAIDDYGFTALPTEFAFNAVTEYDLGAVSEFTLEGVE